MSNETDTIFNLKPKMFSTAQDIKCVLEKEEMINGQWKTRTGLEPVDRRDLMQGLVLNLSHALEQAVEKLR